MRYKDVVRYLESFIDYEKRPVGDYGKSLKLDRIKAFLRSIGNPEAELRCIHVAGTKGKGSTCAFIAYILRQAGYKTGLYTSPHLSDFRERIRILDPRNAGCSEDVFEGMISQSALAGIIKKLKPAIDKYNRNSKYGKLSFFEVYTALAFVYFKEKKVDFVVLETGLGGRLDATNVVEPYLCAITPVSYEHTQVLGRKLAKIAGEKAGIIKDSSLIVVSAPQEREAAEVIKAKCEKTGVRLLEVGKDIVYSLMGKNRFEVRTYPDIDRREEGAYARAEARRQDDGVAKGALRRGRTTQPQAENKTLLPTSNIGIGSKGGFGRYPGLKIKLTGEHQLVNASLAVGVVEALRIYGINISNDSMRKGLYDAFWPARCEIVSLKPSIILDGAQNEASAMALSNTVKNKFKYNKLILVLGISADKDIKGICRHVCPLADRLILTRADTPRASDVDEIGKIGRSFYKEDIIKTCSVKESVELALNYAAQRDLILITGSLFVAGEARKFIKERFFNIPAP